MSPDFITDVNQIRKKYGIDENKGKVAFALLYMTRVDRKKSDAFNAFRNQYGQLSNFNIEPPKNNAKRNKAFDHIKESKSKIPVKTLKNFSLKWNIRQSEAWAILVAEEFPPYFWGFDYRPGGDKAIELRRQPTPNRLWWVQRIRKNSRSKPIWSMYQGGLTPSQIYNKLPYQENEITPEAVRKSINRTKTRMGL